MWLENKDIDVYFEMKASNIINEKVHFYYLTFVLNLNVITVST